MTRFQIFTLFLFVNIQSIFSQANTELGVTAGTSFYTGDIAVTSSVLSQLGFGGGIFAREHMGKFAVRGQLLFLSMRGDEKRFPTAEKFVKRGFNFKTSLVELSLLPEWRPFSFGNLDFYIFAGVSGAMLRTKTFFNDYTPAANVEEDLAKASKFALSIPVGGGLQLFLNETTAISGELGTRKSLSDYIDGISQTANPKSKDYYFYGGLSFSKFFRTEGLGKGRGRMGGRSMRNSKVSCPTF